MPLAWCAHGEGEAGRLRGSGARACVCVCARRVFSSGPHHVSSVFVFAGPSVNGPNAPSQTIRPIPLLYKFA